RALQAPHTQRTHASIFATLRADFRNVARGSRIVLRSLRNVAERSGMRIAQWARATRRVRMAHARTNLERALTLLLGAGLSIGCNNLPEDDGGAAGTVPPEARPIITAGGDFSLLRNTAAPVKETCDLNEILSLPNATGAGPNQRFTEAFNCGDELFSDVFN